MDIGGSIYLFMNDRVNDNSPRFTNLKCVVCNSFGTVTHNRIKCHGCNGLGYIIIDNRTGLPVKTADRKDEVK